VKKNIADDMDDQKSALEAMAASKAKGSMSKGDDSNAMTLMIQRFLDKHGLGDTNATPTPTGSGPASQRSPRSKGKKSPT
jgi:hypothetical protein